MINGDLSNLFTVTPSINSQAIASNTTVNGTALDLRTLTQKGHESQVLAIVAVGSRTDGTYTFALQDSADNSTFAAVTLLAGTVGALSAANGASTGSYIPVAGRPYVRVSVTSTSVTTGASVNAYLVTSPPVA